MLNDSLKTPKRRGRGCLLGVGAILVLLVGLVLVGTIYESVTEASDVRAYPPAGQMIDVGGYRLHINCTGSGSPAVVIDAGWGDWSLGWSRVQPGLAKTTRVCTYDRAGMGYSEPGPLPRDAAHMAEELHTLLDRARVTGPYIMVGHSMGGLTVRVFAHEYPTDVAGVVLIDSMSPGPARAPAANANSNTASESGGPALPSLLARFGLVRLFNGPVPNLPPEARPAYEAFAVTPRAAQTWADEGHGMPANLDQANVVKSFGDLPLIVLTASLNQEADWQALQTGLLQLSSNSQHLFAEKSDHNIQFEQPEAAIGAIVKMVDQIRQSAKH